MKKPTNALTTTKREKFLYAIGDCGGTVMLMFISSYLTLYYTDSIGLAAAYAGSMMLVCRIFDGVSDLIVGALVDSTHTRWGKARPWFVLSILPMAVAYVMMFMVPANMSEGAMKAYTFITYFLVTVVFYTINNVAYHAMLQRISYTSEDRSVIGSMRSMLSTVAGTIMSMLTPMLIPMLGGEKDQGTWSKLVLIYGGFATFVLLLTALGVKEKNIEVSDDRKSAAPKKEKGHLKEELNILLHTKYFYLLIILVLLYFTSSNLNGMSFYYSRDVIGNLAFMSIGGLVTLFPMVIGILFVPKLFAKLGKQKSMVYGFILATVASLAILINPHSMALNIACMLVRVVGTLPAIVALGTLAGDISDYNQMKLGVRSEGLTSSAFTVGIKIGTGLGAAIVGWMLAAGHYDGAAAAQGQSAINAMIITTAVVPAVMYVLSIIALRFWDLEKYQPEVLAFMSEKLAGGKSE